MPPKDSEMSKAIFIAANGEDYDVIGDVTEINTISEDKMAAGVSMDEYIAAVNKSIRNLSKAFCEFTVTLKWSSKQQKRLLEVIIPKYLMTEWRFPKKKPRGTMRRKRREKRRLA